MASAALIERAKSRIGTVLRDKWRLDSLLGVGGSAAVYAATHRNGKRGAIKLLHPELSAQTGLVERFLREGYVANKIQHPGAVSVLDDDVTEDGLAFLVMELLEGYTLERRLRKTTTVPVREALKMIEDLLDVLAAAHDIGIVHRDIKPANIFVTKQKELKVLDFGIARLVEQEKLVYGETQMGQALGTPAFMPPEQARGRWDEVDARTDIWAVGATLWALITGQRPRRADTSQEELMLAMSQPMPSVTVLAPQVSPEVARLVDRALAFEKGGRWPNARTMQQALRLALLLEQASSGNEGATGESLTGSHSIPVGSTSITSTTGGMTPGSLAPSRTSDTTGLRAASITPPTEADMGPLSMSRFDALGPRIPRARPSGQVSLSMTPTGDARLLTTGSAGALETAPLPGPPPPPKRRRTLGVVVTLVLLVGAALGGAQAAGIVDLKHLATRAHPPPPAPAPSPPPPAVNDVTPNAPAPSAAPPASAAPSNTTHGAAAHDASAPSKRADAGP